MREYPPLKTRLEVERLRLAAEGVERVLADLSSIIRPGITTADLEQVALLSMKRNGVSPVLVGYEGFPNAICTSVNNVAVHGLPGSYTLSEGDILTVDVSAERDGWLADAAWTYAVGSVSNEARRLIRTAWRASLAAAAAATAGSRLGDIGAAVEAAAHNGGCTVVASCTGHGIGQALHEPPVIRHTGQADSGEPIVPGMVINVEPVLTLGAGAVLRLQDGYSYVTQDGSLSAQFEFTVAVSAESTRVLTLGRHAEKGLPTSPPYG